MKTSILSWCAVLSLVLSIFAPAICRAHLAILFSYDSKNLPAGETAHIDAALDLIEREIAACTPQESCPVLIHLVWDAIPSTTDLMQISVGGELRDYDVVRALLVKQGSKERSGGCHLQQPSQRQQHPGTVYRGDHD